MPRVALHCAGVVRAYRVRMSTRPSISSLNSMSSHPAAPPPGKSSGRARDKLKVQPGGTTSRLLPAAMALWHGLLSSQPLLLPPLLSSPAARHALHQCRRHAARRAAACSRWLAGWLAGFQTAPGEQKTSRPAAAPPAPGGVPTPPGDGGARRVPRRAAVNPSESVQALLGVAQHQDHGIPPQEHLGDEPVLVHRLAPLGALAGLGNLRTGGACAACVCMCDTERGVTCAHMHACAPRCNAGQPADPLFGTPPLNPPKPQPTPTTPSPTPQYHPHSHHARAKKTTN